MEIRQSLLLAWSTKLRNSGLGISRPEAIKLADEIEMVATQAAKPIRHVSQLEDFDEEFV